MLIVLLVAEADHFHRLPGTYMPHVKTITNSIARGGWMGYDMVWTQESLQSALLEDEPLGRC